MQLTLKETLLKGIEAHKDGKVQEADQYYTSILKSMPNHPEANYNMGVLAVGLGKVQEALPFFKTALKATPSITQFWLSYIDALIKLNQMTDAKAAFDKAKSNGAKGDEFNKLEQRLGSSDLKNSNVQNLPQELLNSLIELYRQNRLQQVFNKAQILIKQYNKSLTLWNLMGTSAAQIGKLDEAVNAFQNAISIKPDYAEAYNNMGNALQDLSKLEESIEAFKKALALKPDYAEAYNNMGNAFQNQGKLEEAIEAFRKALALKPDYAEAYNNMGVALKDQSKLEEAIETFKKALALKTDFAEAYNNMGAALKDQGKLEKAIEAFKKAIKIIPNYAEAYGNMGITLEKNGQLEKALEIYEKGICIMPKNTLLKMNLERLKSRLVPSWHINMMNDKPRNDAYFDAIKLAVSKHDIVLDIGTGSGLLSMMAADFGAERIITCESSKSIFKIAKKIVAANGYNEIIKVINKKSTDLIVGKDLPEKADLIISEILSSEFVGEGIQSTILDANNRLMKSTGKMIPESGEIRIALIGGSPEVSESVFISRVGKFDLTEFNSISGNKVNVKLKEKPNILSDTEIAFKINLFGCKNITEQEKIIVFTAKKSGVCYGLIQWMSINIYEEIKYENMPGETASHWSTPIYLFDEPVSLKLGEKIKIKASLFNDRVWFCEAL